MITLEALISDSLNAATAAAAGETGAGSMGGLKESTEGGEVTIPGSDRRPDLPFEEDRQTETK